MSLPRALVVPLSLATLAVAGCGKDSRKDGSASAPTATASTPAATAAPSAGASTPAGGTGANTDLTRKPTVGPGSAPPPKQLVIQDIVKGSGPGAKRGDQLTMQYVGALYDTGQEFDASWDRGQPFPLQLGVQPVIEGWQRGLVGMKKGGRRKLIIPPDLGYGPQGQGPIPPNATLVFIVDRLS